MSGFICPECDGNYFTAKGKKLQCELCGWVGENDGSRAWLTEEAYDENAKKLAAIKAGKLFTLRVHLKGPDKDRSDTISDVMDLLKLKGMGGSDGNGETRYKAELEEKPADDAIAKIKKMKTVKEVSVFP